MKTTHPSFRCFRLGLLLLGAFALLPAAGNSRAGTLNFHLDLSTASLVANPAAPFALDLQLSRGNGLPNTLTLSNFVFTGGAPVGAAAALGGASGNLGSSVVLRDTGTFNDLYQGFSGTTLDISFDVLSTLNPSAGTPGLFTVSILDQNLFPILTTSPGVGTTAETDYLVGVPIDDSSTLASVRTYSSTVAGSTTPGVSVTASAAAVPEPSSVVLLFALSLGGALGGGSVLAAPPVRPGLKTAGFFNPGAVSNAGTGTTRRASGRGRSGAGAAFAWLRLRATTT